MSDSHYRDNECIDGAGSQQPLGCSSNLLAGDNHLCHAATFLNVLSAPDQTLDLM